MRKLIHYAVYCIVMMTTQKRTLTSKTLAEKFQIIDFVRQNPSVKLKDVCIRFDLKPSTLSTYLKNREEIISAFQSGDHELHKKRIRLSMFEDVDEALLIWFKQKRADNCSIDGESLRIKATHFAVAFAYGDSTEISPAWIERWKKRHQISSKVMSGESAAVDTTIVANWQQFRLPFIMKNYLPEDIYNVDETELFWKLLPDKTLAFKHEMVHGGKKPKDRLTVLVGASMSGEKLPLYVIGKSEKPRAFKNVRKLPVTYHWNKKAWMTGRLWEKWLRDFDKLVNRKVALIVDNCPAHPNIEGLKFVEVIYLPPNTTSKTQPIDCGIIKNLKHFYRRSIAMNRLAAHDCAIEFSFNILDALFLLRESWNKVGHATIQNCFRASGFKAIEINALDESNELVDSEFESIFDRLRWAFGIPENVSVEQFVGRRKRIK